MCQQAGSPEQGHEASGGLDRGVGGEGKGSNDDDIAALAAQLLSGQ